MCGIAGIFNRNGNSLPAQTELIAMIARLRHRGPDGFGYHRDGAIGLAHARLSIIDLAGGAQPIHNEDRSVWVVLNGEIFNYIELRRDLELAGHSFYTHSDTEVIVHLYERYGLDFVAHLNGQFAIALWDANARRLVLARDRVGIRPLFYAEARGRLAFASEVKALFALPEIERALDPEALAQIFTFWSTLGATTPFAGVKALPPGHILVADARTLRIRRYWDWDFSTPPDARRSVADYAEELRALLVDAVRLQLRADVPVGAYLSGGLDSSAITSLIKNFSNTPLRTFSVGFEDAEFDEAHYQRELVRYLGTEHTSLLCRREDIGAAFPRAVLHAESAILRTAPTPLMLLADRVRAAGYKVVLTGEGADEVFAGYDIFKEAKIRRFCARAPSSARRPRMLERLYPYLKNSPTASPAYAQRFFSQGAGAVDAPYYAHIPRWQTTQRSWQFFSPELRHTLRDWDPYAAIRSWLPADVSAWAPQNRDQYIEAHTLMSGYLLSSQGDRMAMAASIEARFPFLDHRVIEFANRVPVRYKLKVLNEKYILKQAMSGLLPESVRTRTKQPYRAPDSQCFFTAARPLPYVAELFAPAALSGAGYFDPGPCAKLVAKCAAGRAVGFADNMAFVGMLSTMLVNRSIVEGAADRGVMAAS